MTRTAAFDHSGAIVTVNSEENNEDTGDNNDDEATETNSINSSWSSPLPVCGRGGRRIGSLLLPNDSAGGGSGAGCLHHRQVQGLGTWGGSWNTILSSAAKQVAHELGRHRGRIRTETCEHGGQADELMWAEVVLWKAQVQQQRSENIQLQSEAATNRFEVLRLRLMPLRVQLRVLRRQLQQLLSEGPKGDSGSSTTRKGQRKGSGRQVKPALKKDTKGGGFGAALQELRDMQKAPEVILHFSCISTNIQHADLTLPIHVGCTKIDACSTLTFGSG